MAAMVRELGVEFPDPGGRSTYFRVRDLAAAVDDELLGLGRR